MNPVASEIFAQGFIKGFLDVVGAMLADTASGAPADVAECTPDALNEALARYTACLQAGTDRGGAIVMLLPGAHVAGVVASVMGEAPPEGDSIQGIDAATLNEVFEPCFGGGVSHFKEAYEEDIVLSDFQVVASDPNAAGELAELLGASATQAPFNYTLPGDLNGEGLLLFSTALEAVVPEGATPAPDPGPQLSPEDVESILGDIGGAAAQQPEAAGGPATSTMPATPTPGNIDMVLDIRLVATARLGRIEMPLHQVLSLGPGSIIEVGHIVDEPVDLLVNNKLIARGDVVVVDEKFGLRITEIVSAKERIESLG